MKRVFCVILLILFIYFLRGAVICSAQSISLKYASQISSGNTPLGNTSGVAVNSVGDIYVIDQKISGVQVFDKNGVYKFKFGAAGTGDGQFQFGSVDYIAIDDSDNVYISDATPRVQAFNSSGAFLYAIGSGGSGDGQFSASSVSLKALAYNTSNKYLYVTDYFNYRVEYFDTQNKGAFVGKFGSQGSANGQFMGTGSILSANGKIYVGDPNNYNIQYFDNGGNYLGAISSPQHQPYALAVDGQGNIYSSDQSARVYMFDSYGNFLGSYNNSGTGNGQLSNGLYGLAFSKIANQLLVADYYSSRIVVFDGPGVVKNFSINNSLYSKSGLFNFDKQLISTTSPAVTISFTNAGGGSLTLGNPAVTLSGANANEFIIDQTTLPTSLAPGSSASFKISFKPLSDANTHAAKLTLNSNDAIASSIDLYLSGTNFTPQTITFNAIPSVAATTSVLNLNQYASSTSSLPLTYQSSDPTVATISGSIATILKVGTTTITASQVGNATYAAASSVIQTLTVVKAIQQINNFTAALNKSINDLPFDLTATASSNLPVSYTSSNPQVATISGTKVTILSIGTTDIKASQAGDGKYLAAADVTQTLTVSKASQTITFNSLPSKLVNDASFELTATSSSSLPVTFTSSNIAVARVSGKTVTIIGAGTTEIVASQAGNDTYASATDVKQNLVVNKVSQTITFAPLGIKILGDKAFALTAVSSSALPINYTSSNPLVATISGSTLTIVGAGTSVINATQPGNDVFLAASDVSQTLTVKLITGLEPSITTSLIAYPNPNAGLFEIETGASVTLSDVEIMDLTGRKLGATLNLTAKENTFVVDITNHEAGIYLIRVKGESKGIRIIKN